MKKLIIGLMFMISTLPSIAGTQWECTSRDAIGKKYSSFGISKDQAKERALENCRTYSNIGNCHFTGINDCTPPSTPAFTCVARDAVGKQYKGDGASKDQAKERALENCRNYSNIGNCHFTGIGDCALN